MAVSQIEKELRHRYNHIKWRCYSPNCHYYDRYGGRGIKMCDEWLNDFYSFMNWALSNGYKKELAIDRIDNNGDYSPDNCRFVTAAENNQNRRSSKFFTYNGKTQNLMQWCIELGLDYNMVLMRIHRGWDFEKAITTKKRQRDTSSIIGEKFGRLTVLEYLGNDKRRNSQFLCQCECGNKVVVGYGKLSSGWTKSCGCLQKEVASENIKKSKSYQKHIEKSLSKNSKFSLSSTDI